jgi:glycosyltransferase involved in cell wall biosynthesis
VRVSVIIPCYNYGRFLGEAIASVRRQTVEDLEIIVVDDGSTDETPEVLAGIRDPRLRSLRTVNGGISAARNAGLDRASGEYLAFLDADDRWLPTKLERQLAMMDGEPGLGMVFTNFSRFDETGTFPKTQFDFIPELGRVPARPSVAGGGFVLTGETFESLLPLGQFATWVQTVLVRHDLVGDLRFPPRRIFNEDRHYMTRVYTRVRAGFITDPLVEVRRHGGNSYEHPEERMEPDVIALRELLHEALTPRQREVLIRRIGNAWSGVGYYHFWNGAARTSLRAYLHAMGYPGQRVGAVTHLLTLPFRSFLPRPQG